MADEQKQSSSGRSKRRRRRRPSRKRKRSNQSGRTDSGSGSSSNSADESGRQTKRRRRRRGRRSRSKTGTQRGENERIKTDLLDAKLPDSILVYTHVLRSSELDTYGFRPDPFLNSSRSLADFRIDLSPLFPEGEPDDDERRIFDAALHGPIVTSLGDGAAYDDSDEEAEDEFDPLADDDD